MIEPADCCSALFVDCGDCGAYICSDCGFVAEGGRELDQAKRAAVAHRDRADRKAARAGAALEDAARLRRAARAVLQSDADGRIDARLLDDLQEAVDYWKDTP